MKIELFDGLHIIMSCDTSCCHCGRTWFLVRMFHIFVVIDVTAEPIYMNTKELAEKIAAKRKSEQENSDSSSTDTTPTGMMTNSKTPPAAPVTKKQEIKV